MIVQTERGPREIEVVTVDQPWDDAGLERLQAAIDEVAS